VDRHAGLLQACDNNAGLAVLDVQNVALITTFTAYAGMPFLNTALNLYSTILLDRTAFVHYSVVGQHSTSYTPLHYTQFMPSFGWDSITLHPPHFWGLGCRTWVSSPSLFLHPTPYVNTAGHCLLCNAVTFHFPPWLLPFPPWTHYLASFPFSHPMPTLSQVLPQADIIPHCISQAWTGPPVLRSSS